MQVSETLNTKAFAGRSSAVADLLRSGALVFLAQTCVNVLNFAFHFFVSRRIGVVAYGSLNALIAGFMVFTTPATILTTVVVKYASEFASVDDRRRLFSLLKRCALWFTGAALTLVLVGFAIAPIIGDYLHIGGTLPVVLTVGILAANIVLSLRGMLQGTERFSAYAFSITFEAFIKLIFALLFIAFGFGIAGALGGWLIGAVLSVAYTYTALLSRYRGASAVPLCLDYRRLAKTTANVTLATLLVSSLGFSDVLLVKHFFDAQTAGLYSAAALCGKMIFMLVSFVPAVILPKAANFKNNGQSSGSVLVYGLIASGGLVLGALAIYLLFPSHVIGALAGHAFEAAAPYVFPYGIAAALVSMINTVVYYRIGSHTFGFLPLLLVIAIGQVGLVSLFHPSILTVITILICCDLAALACVLVGVRNNASSHNAALVS